MSDSANDTVVIFGDGLDQHVLEIEGLLEARGLRVQLLSSPRLLPGPQPFATLGGDAFDYLGGLVPRSAWLYRLPPLANIETLGASYAAIALASQWHARKVRLVNPLGRLITQNKLEQLAALRLAGVPVPDTMVCCSPAQIRTAMAALSPAIAKPVAQGWHTVLLDETTDLTAVPLPCLVQRRADGADLRVTVVDGRVISAIEIDAQGEVDFRAGEDYERGEAHYTPTTLTPSEREVVDASLSATGYLFAGIDIKRASTGSVVLEANPAPAFLDIEQKTGHPVSTALAELLAK